MSESKPNPEAEKKAKAREESLKILGNADFAIAHLAAAYMQARTDLIARYGSETEEGVMRLLEDRFYGKGSKEFSEKLKEIESKINAEQGNLGFLYRTRANNAQLATGLAGIVQESLASITLGDYVKALGVKAEGISEDDKKQYFIDYVKQAKEKGDKKALQIAGSLQGAYLEQLYSNVRKQIIDAGIKAQKSDLEKLLEPEKKESKK